VCVALCKWQLDRWEWKKGELEAREKALARGERTLADVLAAARRGEPVDEYTAVVVEGTLQCERSVRIAPRVRSVHGSPMPGAMLITAVRLRGASKKRSDDERVVLVNRGWVPEGWREPEGGACLKAHGVTRLSETPGSFTPPNDPATKRFHWVDVPAIAEALGLRKDTPLVQLARAGDRDRGNAAPTSFPAPAALADLRAFKVKPEDHVNYAATWGGLAIATGGGALYALAGRGKGAAAAARSAAARVR
jgi:surfeit locus 1 family protein